MGAEGNKPVPVCRTECTPTLPFEAGRMARYTPMTHHPITTEYALIGADDQHPSEWYE